MNDFMWIIQLATTSLIGVFGFFVKGTMNKIETGIKDNDLKIKEVNNDVTQLRTELNDLKADLPFVYTLREDFIRSLNNVDTKMNNIDGKLDKLIQIKSGKGE